MRYDWDEKKNHENQGKHERDLIRTGCLVFEDSRVLVRLDRLDETGEQRWHAIGSVQIDSEPTAVLLVVHAYREATNGQEIIRIISARSAEKHELHRYQKQTLD